MNDADWIRLLGEQSPRELSDDDIAALRERIGQSPAVRQAARDSLRLEETLSAGLGDIQLSPEDLLQRVLERGRRPNRNTRPAWWKWIGLAAGIALLAALLSWWRQPVDGEQNVADSAADRPVDVADPIPDAVAQPLRTGMFDLAIGNPDVVSALSPVNLAAMPVLSAEPWSDWLAEDVVPLPPDSPRLVGDLKAMDHDELPLSEFRRWWTDVPNQRAGLNQDVIGQRKTIHLQGWAKLKAPWLSDTQIRLTPFDVRELSLVFWAGDEGVLLKQYRQREPHVWAAYRVQRRMDEFAPESLGLLTTDNGAFYHRGAATFEVAVEDGQLILSAGQWPLLTVPFADSPTDVLLSAESRFRGFSWIRTQPRDLPVAEPLPSVFGDQPPAAWSWRMDQAGQSMLQLDADGGVTLTGTSMKDVARVYVPLERPGVFETIVQLATADPGTGVYLGDAAGQPLGQLAFFQNRRDQRTTLGFLKPNERRLETDFDERSQPVPYFVPRTWQRLVAGLGVWNTWCSGDGQHFGHLPENPVRDVTGAVRSVGLYCLPGETPRTIRLSQAFVRPLLGGETLVQPQFVEAAERGLEVPPKGYDDWLQRAWDQKPLGASLGDWCDTYAAMALFQGPPRDLANALLDRLVRSSVERGVSASEQRKLLDDVLLLTDHWHDQDALRWSRRYAEWGLNSGNDPNGVEAWRAYLQAPRWTPRHDRERFQRRLTGELLTAAYREDWTSIVPAARVAAFDTAAAHPDHQPRDAAEALERVARWSRSHAAESRTVAALEGDEGLPVSWRHPLQWTVNKEAYNVSAELQAALSTEAYRDAGRIVTSLTGADSLGLLPDRRDSSLLISLPIALGIAQQDAPELAEVLQDEFGELGRLRVSQAIADGDVAALQESTLQFPGTAAAVDAERWLGDRQLAIGNFLAAGLHYRRALHVSSAEQRAEIEARLELVARLIGPLPGETVSPDASTKQVAGVAVASLAAERPVTIAAPRTPGELLPRGLRMQPLRLEPRGRFDGLMGQNAGRGEYRDSDPFGRQFGIAADRQQVYLSNRFQVSAYRSDTGQQSWSTAIGSDPGDAHAHRFHAMSPLVIGSRVVVRRLLKTSVELTCLDAANGNVLWSYQPGANAAVLTDPVWAGGRLYAIVGGELEQDLWDLRWTEFDLARGQPLAATSVMRLRNAWDKEIPCQLVIRGPQVILSAGGATVSFDLLGEVHWQRRDLWLPPRIDPRQFDHYVLPPVFSRDVVLTAQPNVRVVQGLDPRTGRRLWRRPLPDLTGLVAVDETLAIAAEPENITALDVSTGGVLWQADVPGWLGPVAIQGEHVIAVRRETRKDRRGWLVLTWLDRATGRVVADCPVDAGERDDWRAGPWFRAAGQVWLLTEAGAKTAQRDLSVLMPVSGSTSTTAPLVDTALGPWSAIVSAEDRHATHVVLPGWQPLLSNRETLAFVPDDVRGERNVLRTKVSKSRQLSFGRMVTLRDDAMPVLQLRIGREGDAAWKLVVRVDDQIVHEQLVDAETAASGWCDVHLPLGAFNGQTFLLQVQQHTSGDRSATALWKAADLVSE